MLCSLPFSFASVSLPRLRLVFDAVCGRGVVPKQVIIIPAALVSPFAYSILARSLAQRGYPCFVVRLPFNLGACPW